MNANLIIILDKGTVHVSPANSRVNDIACGHKPSRNAMAVAMVDTAGAQSIMENSPSPCATCAERLETEVLATS